VKGENSALVAMEPKYVRYRSVFLVLSDQLAPVEASVFISVTKSKGLT
jgi:hypothetical protein